MGFPHPVDTASMTMKYFASLAEISATASAGFGDWYRSRLSYLFRQEHANPI